MAEINFTLPPQQEVARIAARVQEIAAILAGFTPTLDQHLDHVDKEVGDSLAMLAGLTQFMQFELSTIGERLEMLGAPPK